jgi:outer membrane autotransporter protein
VRAARQDDLTVFVDFTMSAGKLAALPGLSPAGRAVAVAIDKFCPALGNGPSADPNVNDLRLRCNELIAAIGSDPTGVSAALEELYADVALVQSSSGLLAAQAQFDNIKARIAALRSGTRGISFGGLAISNGRASAPVGALFDTLLADGGSQETGAEFQRWGFFAAGTIGRGDAERGIINPAYDFDIKGLTAGVDYRYSDKWIFGGTVGYTRQDNTLTGAEGQLNTHGWSVSAYTTYYQSNSWYSDAVLSYGSNRYEMERRLRYTFTLPGSLRTTVDQRSSADSDGTSLSFAGSFGRDFNRGAWGVGPYARFMVTKLNFDATTERMAPGAPGSGLALVIQTRDVTSVSSVLGGKLTYAHSANWGVLIPHLQAEWQHEFKDDPSEVEAHFLYDPTATPFTITGDKLDTDFFRFGLGLSMVLTHGRSGFFYYEKLIGRDGISQDSLALGLRIEF